MNSAGSGSSGGGGAPTGGGVGAMSGGRGGLGSGERAGGGSPTFSSRGLNLFKPGIEGPKSSPMINLKNATEANSKFARSESLAFRAEGAKPMINLNQPKAELQNPKVEFGRPMIKAESHKAQFERSNERIRAEQKQTADQKIQTTEAKPILPTRQKSVFERKFNPETSTHKEAFKKIIQERYQHHGYKFEPAVAIARKTEIKQAALQALKANSEPATKTIPAAAEKVRTKVTTQNTIDSRVKTQIERAVKTAMAKISRVEAKTATQPKIETQTQTTPNVRVRENILQKVQTEIKLQPKTSVQTETQTQVATQVEAEIATKAKTKTETQSQTQVAQEIKAEIGKKTETQTTAEGVEITDVYEKVKEDEKDPKEPKKRFAYFEVDTKTNAKRIQEVIKAFTKAKIAAFLRGQIHIRGKDIAANLDAVNMKKTESKSIERIEDDGSAKLFTEYIAKEGVVASMEDIRQVAANAVHAATATNLTEKPNNQVVGKKEALLVHNGQTVFLANLDGKPAVVKLDENITEAA